MLLTVGSAQAKIRLHESHQDFHFSGWSQNPTGQISDGQEEVRSQVGEMLGGCRRSQRRPQARLHSQARAELHSCSGQELGQPYLTLLKLEPIPRMCCCFDPSSREWAQMKLKQVLIKTRTILQTGLLITVNTCQGELQRKIVISCATCHFHLITITLFCRAKTSVFHNKLLSWGLVWIESCEALPWVPKLAA